MNLQRNYYEVLGVGPEATEQEIKNKYRELARKFHPDLVKDKALGVKVFSQVNKAYHTLGDPERRKQYDEQQLGEKVRSRNGSGTGNTTRTPSNYAQQPAPPPVQQVQKTVTLSASQQAQLDRSINLAEASIMEGQFEQARELCEAVLRIDGRNARALGVLGDAYTSLNRTESAIKVLRMAQSISPSSMVEAKLRRLEQSAAKPAPEKIAPRPNGTGQPETKQPGGLFSKLMGRKQ
jgi:curved DNA-binding protein CbpA